MKQIISLLTALALCISLAACGGTEQAETQEPSASPSQSVEVLPDTPSDPEEPEETPGAAEGSGILIAYFTWADNTVVEDPNAVDVDATTSASVLIPGNTAIMAQFIQQQVGGDLFSIRVTELYSSDYDECLDRAADEKAENTRPELAETVDNIADYDIVFLGFPNWWYTCPMAIFSFVEQHDLSGKTVIPFVAHGTGGLSSTIRDLTAALPEDAAVLEPVGIYRDDMPQAQDTISAWLDGLGVDFSASAEPDAEAIQEETVMRMTMTVDGQEISVTLLDNPTARALWEQLPLTLMFEDYNGTEKIAYPPEELSQEGAPASYDPSAGDVTVYGPWGNIAIFYQDFRDSAGLIPIGHIDTGLELLSGQAGDFTATLDRAE